MRWDVPIDEPVSVSRLLPAALTAGAISKSASRGRPRIPKMSAALVPMNAALILSRFKCKCNVHARVGGRDRGTSMFDFVPQRVTFSRLRSTLWPSAICSRDFEKSLETPHYS